jgi:hypothetical protein
VPIKYVLKALDHFNRCSNYNNTKIKSPNNVEKTELTNLLTEKHEPQYLVTNITRKCNDYLSKSIHMQNFDSIQVLDNLQCEESTIRNYKHILKKYFEFCVDTSTNNVKHDLYY